MAGELQDQVDQLATRLAQLRVELDQEKDINAEQNEHLKAVLKSLKRRQQWIDVPVLSAIAFFVLLGICLLSLRVEYQGFTFGVPIEALTKAIEVPAIASAVTAVVTVIVKKVERDHI
jgi:hypothetical protein